MKTVLLVLLFFLVLGALVALLLNQPQKLLSPFVGVSEKPKILEKYSFENLRRREYQGSEIKLEKVIKEESAYTSWLFSYLSDGKKITGMANLPKRKGKLPVVVMLRGYVEDEVYFTGLGTRKAAGFFAENGFITLAPDFLGFAGSSPSSLDILEARFYRPVEVLNLLASVKTLAKADPEKIFLWGHSNGGQIALSVLEISQKPYPTTLWAPVTRGFPQSVLDYMGELDDQGKKVKAAIEEFLKIYNPEKFSITNYFADIQAPLQVHQGMADEYIKTGWIDEFVSRMESLDKKVTYFKYPRNDHNLKQSWDLVVARDLEFFRKNLK
ncbi:MAG: alpha/beta hydrolase family protein [Patescibacteria group bacterium]